MVQSLSPKLLDVAEGIDDLFISSGCRSYVKTIYVGYQFGEEMVGALYPYADHLELALALEVETTSRLLVDATHLTWKTMPVAAVLTNVNEMPEASKLVANAVARIKSGSHSVFRDSAYFQMAKAKRFSPRRRYDSK
jgi:hypothetical protein